MKLREGIITSQVMGDYVAIPTGQAGEHFHGMLRGNETADFILQCLKSDTSYDAILGAMLSRYDVSRERATDSLNAVLAQLRANNLLTDE